MLPEASLRVAKAEARIANLMRIVSAVDNIPMAYTSAWDGVSNSLSVETVVVGCCC